MSDDFTNNKIKSLIAHANKVYKGRMSDLKTRKIYDCPYLETNPGMEKPLFDYLFNFKEYGGQNTTIRFDILSDRLISNYNVDMYDLPSIVLIIVSLIE